MIKTRGNLQVRTLPKLTVSQLYPEERKEINLNTCGDPDCGNFGVSPDPVFDQFLVGEQKPGAKRRDEQTRRSQQVSASTG